MRAGVHFINLLVEAESQQQGADEKREEKRKESLIVIQRRRVMTRPLGDMWPIVAMGCFKEI